MEVKFEVRTYEIDYECPLCRSSFMRPIGGRDGRMQEHVCDNGACGNRVLIEDKVYPIRLLERVAVKIK